MGEKNKCNGISYCVAECKKKIIEMIENTENLDYLEFIYNMMRSFKKKWGI